MPLQQYVVEIELKREKLYLFDSLEKRMQWKRHFVKDFLWHYPSYFFVEIEAILEKNGIKIVFSVVKVYFSLVIVMKLKNNKKCIAFQPTLSLRNWSHTFFSNKITFSILSWQTSDNFSLYFLTVVLFSKLDVNHILSSAEDPDTDIDHHPLPSCGYRFNILLRIRKWFKNHMTIQIIWVW